MMCYSVEKELPWDAQGVEKLPCYVYFWYIWRERHMRIFSDKGVPMHYLIDNSCLFFFPGGLFSSFSSIFC